MTDWYQSLPRRTLGFGWILALLLAPLLALSVLPRTDTIIFATTMFWLLISAPLAIVTLVDWSHRRDVHPGHLSALARVPARILALVAVTLGVGFPLRALLQPNWRPLAGTLRFGLMMVVLGHGLWQSTRVPK
jgi:hypothetical protein